MSFPFDVDPHLPAIGLIALQADETIEQDFRRIFDWSTLIYVTRVPSATEVTSDTLQQMAATLPAAARLFPTPAKFAAVGYGCTSGTTLIGAKAVAQMLRQGVDTPVVTDPLTAALAALRALGARRLGLVTPYIDSIAGPVRDAFGAAGIDVCQTLSFGEEVEARVARISPQSIIEAARAAALGAEAVFLSCTNLRTLGCITALEAELGLPVLSSNQVLAWHMMQTTAITPRKDAPGRLFQSASLAG